MQIRLEKYGLNLFNCVSQIKLSCSFRHVGSVFFEIDSLCSLYIHCTFSLYENEIKQINAFTFH